MSKLDFMSIKIDNITMEQAMDEIVFMAKNGKNQLVVSPNVDNMVRLEEDQEFRKIYDKADLVLTDGQPIIWFSKFFGEKIKEKISGSDLSIKLCGKAAENNLSIFLLGAAEGVGEAAAKRMKETYKGLEIAGIYSPKMGFENDPQELDKIVNLINEADPDLLYLGLGSPKQEKFFISCKDRLNVPVALALGASIDFMAGEKRRAPVWMSNVGLEWLYRLCQEPKRLFKRYLVDDMRFFKYVFRYMKEENKKSS